MLGTRIAIGTGIATALAGVAIGAPGSAARSLDRHHDCARLACAAMPAWKMGLGLRSDALNRTYGLGRYAVSANLDDARAAPVAFAASPPRGSHGQETDKVAAAPGAYSRAVARAGRPPTGSHGQETDRDAS